MSQYDPTCAICGGCYYDCFYGNPKQPHCQSTSKPQTDTDMKRYYMSEDKELFFQVEKIETQGNDTVCIGNVVHTGESFSVVTSVSFFIEFMEDWQVITKQTFYRAYNRTKERLDKAVFGEDDKPNISFEDIKEFMKVKFSELKCPPNLESEFLKVLELLEEQYSKID